MYDNLKEARSTGSASETRVSEDDEHCIEASTESAAFHSWPDLLTELRLVYILDKEIMEEHLKNYDTQCSEETPNKELCERPSDKSSSVSKEKECFWLQLEKEKKEGKLEKKLDRECKVKKHKDKFGADLVPGAVTEATGSCFEDEPSGYNRTTLNSISGLKQPAKKSRTKLLGCVYWKDLDTSGEKVTICKPEASLIPETWPDDGMFDPGGKSLHPPMPRKASLPMSNNFTELESPCSTELTTPALSSVAQGPGFVQLDLQDESIKSQQENVTPAISCHLKDASEITTRSDEEAPNMEIRTSSLGDECLVEQSAPQLLPDQSLELDPGGRDDLTENLLDVRLAPFSIDIGEVQYVLHYMEETLFKGDLFILKFGSIIFDLLLKCLIAHKNLKTHTFPHTVHNFTSDFGFVFWSGKTLLPGLHWSDEEGSVRLTSGGLVVANLSTSIRQEETAEPSLHIIFQK